MNNWSSGKEWAVEVNISEVPVGDAATQEERLDPWWQGEQDVVAMAGDGWRKGYWCSKSDSETYVFSMCWVVHLV